jgi:hypothetical protein
MAPSSTRSVNGDLDQSRSEDQLVSAEPNDDERATALAEVERDYPGWHTWPGVPVRLRLGPPSQLADLRE